MLLCCVASTYPYTRHTHLYFSHLLSWILRCKTADQIIVLSYEIYACFLRPRVFIHMDEYIRYSSRRIVSLLWTFQRIKIKVAYIFNLEKLLTQICNSDYIAYFLSGSRRILIFLEF